MRLAMAAAGPMSPASSRFTMATDASTVLGEYRKTTADTVVIAFTKRYRLMSRMAGKHTGTVTRKKVRQKGTLSDADTASNSASICFNAVTAVRCDDE